MNHVRELLDNRVIQIEYIPRIVKITDILTKWASFENVRKMICLMNLDSFWKKIIETIHVLLNTSYANLHFRDMFLFSCVCNAIFCFVYRLWWDVRFRTSKNRCSIIFIFFPTIYDSYVLQNFLRSRFWSLLVWKHYYQCVTITLYFKLLLWLLMLDHNVSECWKMLYRKKKTL